MPDGRVSGFADRREARHVDSTEAGVDWMTIKRTDANGVGLKMLGPSAWLKVLGHPAPLNPPTLVAMPLTFAVCIGVSVLDRSRRAEQDRAGHAGQRRRMGGANAVAAEWC